MRLAFCRQLVIHQTYDRVRGWGRRTLCRWARELVHGWTHRLELRPRQLGTIQRGTRRDRLWQRHSWTRRGRLFLFWHLDPLWLDVGFRVDKSPHPQLGLWVGGRTDPDRHSCNTTRLVCRRLFHIIVRFALFLGLGSGVMVFERGQRQDWLSVWLEQRPSDLFSLGLVVWRHGGMREDARKQVLDMALTRLDEGIV
jgi:hypothetical protein